MFEEKLLEIKKNIAEKFKNNEQTILFSYIDREIINASSSSDLRLVNELILLKAECYQRIGKLNEATYILKKFDKSIMSDHKVLDFEILQMKLTFQNGEWGASLHSSKSILGSYKERRDSVLWRTALLYSIDNDIRKSKYYSEMHRERIQLGGFQDANNDLYTLVIPELLHEKKEKSLTKILDPIYKAQEIYINSNINFDTTKKIGSRVKSYCQAMLIEAFAEWGYGNKYNSYVLVLLTGLCMNYSSINLKAEGIGEIIKLFYIEQKTLIKLIMAFLNKAQYNFWIYVKKNFQDNHMIEYAYQDALIKFDKIITQMHRQNDPNNYEIISNDEGKRTSAFPSVSGNIIKQF